VSLTCTEPGRLEALLRHPLISVRLMAFNRAIKEQLVPSYQHDNIAPLFTLLRAPRESAECGRAGASVVACSPGHVLELTTSAGTIESPGYAQSQYPNDAFCQWRIQAPAGAVRRDLWLYITHMHR